ncbi:hypothetical protein Tco_0068852 [Tanacetum coccineum]
MEILLIIAWEDIGIQNVSVAMRTDYEIPTNAVGLIEYTAHPFWQQKYCPSYEHDRTRLCRSCQRMRARDTKYLLLR